MASSSKRESVATLVADLERDLELSVYTTSQARDAALEQLKIYGRDPVGSDAIYTAAGINTIARHAFSTKSHETSRCALRVLANALLLRADTRSLLVAMGQEGKIVQVMRRSSERAANDSWDDEFLGTRILFLMTYAHGLDLNALVEKYKLVEVVKANLERHVGLLNKPSNQMDVMETMALSETAKLVFNITTKSFEFGHAFVPVIEPLISLLWRTNATVVKPLEQPMDLIVNALLNLDLNAPAAQTALFPQHDIERPIARLIKLLEASLKAYDDTVLEQTVTPLVSVIRSAHKCAPPEPQASIRRVLLPTVKDRESVLGKGESLPARLLANIANPLTPNLSATVSQLLYDMSECDAHKFVDNIGYGLASGFLFQQGIAPPDLSRVQELTDDDQEESRNGPASTGNLTSQRPTNPITGQFLDAEPAVDLSSMSDEEKEREAERLFVLFERLRRNGVMTTDPMRAALEQGKFEELD